MKEASSETLKKYEEPGDKKDLENAGLRKSFKTEGDKEKCDF